MKNDLEMVDAASADSVRVRACEPADLPAAYALSSALQWPHRINDWKFALSLGKGVVAERAGKVMGTALSWAWGERHATIGLVIVAPELQGRRVGNRMMQALLDLRAPRDVLLHATAAGRGLYERLGFVATGEVSQHQGVLPKLPPPLDRAGDRLRLAENDDFDTLIEMDARGVGMHRPELFRPLLSQATTVVLERDGRPAGFAVVRRFGHGHMIGPVAAPDIDAARMLVTDCCRRVDGFLRIDVHANSGMSIWLVSLGLARVGGGTVMVRGRAPERGPAYGSWALFMQAIG
jgi:GNAT superfamily N-acetyltransferase